jgi:hypothetical protein
MTLNAGQDAQVLCVSCIAPGHCTERIRHSLPTVRRGGSPAVAGSRWRRGLRLDNHSAPPLLTMHDSAAGLHGHVALLGLNDQEPSQHGREFAELGVLPGLSPASRTAHVCDAQAVLAALARPTYSSISLGGWLAAATGSSAAAPVGDVQRRQPHLPPLY